MAKLVERDGKLICVEEDGAEWEYTPAEPSKDVSKQQLPLNDIVAQLLLDSATKDAKISQQSDMIAGLMMTFAQLQGGA